MSKNYGPGKCVICGQTFLKHTSNVKVCGDDCARERDNRRKRINKGPLITHQLRTCVVCGRHFRGKQPYYPYKCCGAPECRKALRQRVGVATAEKQRERALTVLCLVCGCEFKSPNKFIRTCPGCKDAQRQTEVYAWEWGRII